MRRLSLALVIAALAASAVLVSGAQASGSAPCWSQVINDWYKDGRIDGRYPIACYRQALRNLPSDVQAYADANDVINRALQAAIAANAVKSGGGPTTTNPHQATNGHAGTTTTTTGTTESSDTGQTDTTAGPGSGGGGGGGGPTTTPTAPTHHETPFSNAIKRLGPNDANAIPLPLVILGVLALLLLAAGAAGAVARKLQERRGLATPAGSPPSEPPPAA